MYDSASTIMQQKLSQIQGVGQVFVGGASYPSVRVEVNPPQLHSYGLTLAGCSPCSACKTPTSLAGRSPTER